MGEKNRSQISSVLFFLRGYDLFKLLFGGILGAFPFFVTVEGLLQ